jgi:GntR family transcriptional regulator, histidine utilization repressor
MKLPKYRFISDEIKKKISSSLWKVGHQIPSETDLAHHFSASRMTARKAVDELVNDGVLERVASVGTFVKKQTVASPLLEIRNIADEIHARGHAHTMTVLSKLTLIPNDTNEFSQSLQSKSIFKIIVVHAENGVPIQLEERYVNADQAPKFLQQDFSQITASEYLNSIAPLTEAEITVEAVMPTKILKHNLQLEEDVPCLKVTRLTQSYGKPVCYTVLYHPANRFKLTGHLNIKA